MQCHRADGDVECRGAGGDGAAIGHHHLHLGMRRDIPAGDTGNGPAGVQRRDPEPASASPGKAPESDGGIRAPCPDVDNAGGTGNTGGEAQHFLFNPSPHTQEAGEPVHVA